jgi:Phytanoyl-CoA dioxygenase (PhyH)
MKTISGQFNRDGFALIKRFFSESEIDSIRAPILAAHSAWIQNNKNSYESNAVNSALLTSPKYCQDADNLKSIYRFISMEKLVELSREISNQDLYFLNSQLFFNPVNKEQKPYWHRDIQYSGLPEEKQMELIQKDTVLHFRVPLATDPGLEFVPGSHLRWDTEEEREIRLKLNGKMVHEPISNSVKIPHEPQDLLVFSAHALHKGVYGGDRLSFDIILSSFKESAENIEMLGHFPDEATRRELKNGNIFAVS